MQLCDVITNQSPCPAQPLPDLTISLLFGLKTLLTRTQCKSLKNHTEEVFSSEKQNIFYGSILQIRHRRSVKYVTFKIIINNKQSKLVKRK